MSGQLLTVTPEILDTLVELLPTVDSLRDLCAVTGLRLDTVRRETAPFLAIMKLQGTHPQCGCGRDRFHPYGCADSFAKGNHDKHVPGVPLALAPVVLARRAAVLDAIMSGDRFCDIEAQLGLAPHTGHKYVRFLSPEQRAERKHLQATRGRP